MLLIGLPAAGHVKIEHGPGRQHLVAFLACPSGLACVCLHVVPQSPGRAEGLTTETTVPVSSFHYRHLERDIFTTGPTRSSDFSTGQDVLKNALRPLQVLLLHPYDTLLFCRNWCWRRRRFWYRLWSRRLLQTSGYPRDLLQPLRLIFRTVPHRIWIFSIFGVTRLVGGRCQLGARQHILHECFISPN